jgi:hypothetical protein
MELAAYRAGAYLLATMAAPKNPKPSTKLAGTLVLLGMSLFMLERFGLDWIRKPGNGSGHIDGTVLSVLVVAPLLLIAGGCIVFVVGAMLRPR